MNCDSLSLLKDEVERIYGRKVLTASDCQFLCKDIYQRTQFQVSLNTLRRTFNLMKSKYQPSMFTLDLLSKYCGYSSLTDFVSQKEEAMNHNNHDNNFGLLNFLSLLFNDRDIKNIDDVTYINLVHDIIYNLEKWPNVIDAFQQQVAKKVNGQIFYFEQFVNIDKLNSYYGNGLRYYINEKKTVEAQIFGHSLLCFRYWLAMKDEEVERQYNEVKRMNIKPTAHPFIAGRYFASMLYYGDVFKDNIEAVLSQAREFYGELKAVKHPDQSFPCFEYILSEALILINQHEEALYYISESVKKRNNHFPPHIDLKLFESIYLFQAIALGKTGQVDKSREILEIINTKNFYFLSKQFNTILYLLLKRSYLHKDCLDRQLQDLVGQTGFKRLIMNWSD